MFIKVLPLPKIRTTSDVLIAIVESKDLRPVHRHHVFFVTVGFAGSWRRIAREDVSSHKVDHIVVEVLASFPFDGACGLCEAEELKEVVVLNAYGMCPVFFRTTRSGGILSAQNITISKEEKDLLVSSEAKE